MCLTISIFKIICYVQYLSEVDLLNYSLKLRMVRPERLELSWDIPTWPSTKPVYQFQHGRLCGRLSE